MKTVEELTREYAELQREIQALAKELATPVTTADTEWPLWLQCWILFACCSLLGTLLYIGYKGTPPRRAPSHLEDVQWNGQHGQDDSNIFRVSGKNNVWEDCAGWGENSRKIFDGAQAGNVEGSGFRRCWGEWNDYPQGGSQPTLTYQVGYNSTNQLPACGSK